MTVRFSELWTWHFHFYLGYTENEKCGLPAQVSCYLDEPRTYFSLFYKGSELLKSVLEYLERFLSYKVSTLSMPSKSAKLISLSILRVSGCGRDGFGTPIGVE